ncbi:MAG: protein phosphatase 2C domain-containing protein [Myxococcota bacterium]|nr:protein phosphatase 2C domain-containing protein [Myxococcota bacterium]
MTLDAWLVTDVGVVRDHNEDCAYMESTEGFFIVADGMGGHAAGEVASAMAVETVQKTLEGARSEIDAFKKAPTDAGRRGLVQLLQNAVLGAHQAVYQRGQAEQDKAGMGTTLDVVLIAGPEAFVAHVGDSRTYLIREGRSSQITTDHTVAEVLVIEGKLTIEEAQVSPLRTILVNAIGVSADVGVEMAHVTLKKGDRILLCSDGLHDYFPIEEEIAQKLSEEKPGAALAEMVELAKTRGGHDNITGVAIHVLEIVEAAVPEPMTGESTQPVDVASNPFADEPTETAFIAPPGLPPRMIGATNVGAAQGLKVTTPMRVINEETHADTIPPIEARKAKPEDKQADATQPDDATPKADAPKDDSVPTEIATADTGRVQPAKSEPKDSGDKKPS